MLYEDGNMEELDVADEKEAKKWLFQENIRLEQQKKELEEEREQLERQKRDFQTEQNIAADRNRFLQHKLDNEKKLFEMKWKLLEQEVIRVAEEKRRMEREREEFQAVQAEQPGYQYTMFFVGVSNKLTLKKRYKDLIKIYHPDNLAGDKETLQEINREYDHLKQIFV